MTALMIIGVTLTQQHGYGNTIESNSDGPIPSINNIGSPACTNGLTYCEKVDNYPSDLIQRLLQNTTYLFHNSPEIELLPAVVAKKNLDDEETPCLSFRRLIRPLCGRSISDDDSWMFIVNNENHTQLLYGEECRHNEKCELIIGDFARCIGYNSRCVQRKLPVLFIALLPNGTLAPRYFEMPSSCECVLSRTITNACPKDCLKDCPN